MNTPDCGLPELSRKLKSAQVELPERRSSIPKHHVQPDKIKEVRVNTQKIKGKTYIFPELNFRTEWIKFRVKNVSLMSVIKPLSINGITGFAIDRKSKEIHEEWEEWLKSFIKDNNLDVKLVKTKVGEEKKEKKEKKQKKDIEENIIEEQIIDVAPESNEDHDQDNIVSPQ